MRLSNNFPAVRVFGDISYGTGYNNSLRGLLQCLKALGLGPEKVRVVGAVSASGYQEALEHDWFHDYVYNTTVQDDRINIVHLNPGMVGDYHTAIGGRYNIAYCSWETDRLPSREYEVNGKPRSAVRDLNQYDEVWVPIPSLVDVFVASGVTVPIYVVPHALQEELLARLPVAKPANEVLYYTIGSWNERKAPEKILRAWFATPWKFGREAVRLLLHCVPPSRNLAVLENASAMTLEAVKQLREAAGDRGQSAPPYGILTTPRAYSQILDLHQQGTVFVTASRGEGFGLGALEALAMGNWVIGGGHALEDLFDAVNSDKLPAPVRVLATRQVPITPMPECRGYELDHEWWDITVNDLRDAMVSGLPAADRLRGEMPNHDFIAHVRHTFAPQQIGERFLRTRLEHAAEILANSGW